MCYSLEKKIYLKENKKTKKNALVFGEDTLKKKWSVKEEMKK